MGNKEGNNRSHRQAKMPLLHDANRALREKHYETALDLYLKLLKKGKIPAEIVRSNLRIFKYRLQTLKDPLLLARLRDISNELDRQKSKKATTETHFDTNSDEHNIHAANRAPNAKTEESSYNKYVKVKNKKYDKQKLFTLLNGQCKLSIFNYESLISKNKKISARSLKLLERLNESFDKYYYILAIKYFINDFHEIESLIERLLEQPIPSYIFQNDNYLRLVYLIAKKVKSKKAFSYAYYSLAMNIGCKIDDGFLMTRRHAYICESAVNSGIENLPLFRGQIVNLDEHRCHHERSNSFCDEIKINVVGIIRLRNEVNIVESCIACLSNHVDSIVIYDDCSDDGTAEKLIELKSKYPANFVEIKTNEEWLFNEAYAHSILFEAARNKGATHILQVDADEVLSGTWLEDKHALKNILLQMKPGDVLALPWIDLISETSMIERERVTGQGPFFRGMMFKDVIYCDDGLTEYDKDNLIHVNIVPRTYRNRLIINDTSYGLLHLEFFNALNLAVKKDWYRIFEYINNGKSFNNGIYDISNEIKGFTSARQPYKSLLSNYVDFSAEGYYKIVRWRILYNYKAYKNNLITHEQYKSLLVDYEQLITSDNILNIQNDELESISLYISNNKMEAIS